MRRLLSLAASAAMLASLAPLAAGAQRSENPNAFSWKGNIPAGAWLNVKNLNGSVRVEQGTGSAAEVTASESWDEGDPKDVHFIVQHYGADTANVLICALWGQNSSCDEDGYHSHGDHRGNDHNDVEVRIVVRLPRGVKVDAGTVNGAVDVSGATAEVRAHTVNGDVTASTATGPVSATTVNGSVNAHMDALSGDGDMRFSTVNGSVRVDLPAQLDADIDLSTVNGGFQTDYPITIDGRFNPRHIRATIGKGGRRIEARTVNGSVTLRKS